MTWSTDDWRHYRGQRRPDEAKHRMDAAHQPDEALSIACQSAIAELCEGLREARAVISVLMDTAADFTEVDQQNCEHARLLCGRLEALLSKHSPDAPGQHAGTRATESGDGDEA